MSYSYADLRAELTSDPLARGYPSLSDADAAASLNALSRSITVDVPIPTLFATLLRTGAWTKIRTAAAGQQSMAQAASLTVVDLVTTQRLEAVSTTDAQTMAAVTATLTALVAGSVLTSDEATGLMAMTTRTISRAEEIGWPAGVSNLDIAAARRA